MGNGALIGSNFILGSTLIYLAESEIGCEDGDCGDRKVYGFKPSSLLTLSATVSALLSAFLLPIVGAIVDYTSHRRRLGICTALLLMTIQAVQIGTNQSTWFIMLILQSINGFLYHTITLTGNAYLPEIASLETDDKATTAYSAKVFMHMFTTESLFLIIVSAVAIALNLDTVRQSMFSQGLDVVVSGFAYFLAWYFLQNRQPKAILPERSTLLSEGFRQVASTAKGIFKYYPTTLLWFFMAVIFGQAGKNCPSSLF